MVPSGVLASIGVLGEWPFCPTQLYLGGNVKIINIYKDEARGGVFVKFDSGSEHYIASDFIVELYIECLLGIRPGFHDAPSGVIPHVLLIDGVEHLWFPKAKREVADEKI